MDSAVQRGASPGAGFRAGLERLVSPGGAVALITLAALALRASQMDQSLFGDELYSYHDIAGRSLVGMLRAIHPPAENAPPLFFILAWFSAKLGNPTVWLRLPSLLLSTATIPIVYLLGRDTVSRAAGVIAAAILAASPFTVYYAIEARPYASVACFVTLAALAAVRAVRTRRHSWWVVFVLSADAAAYSHYTGIFALAVLGAWALWVSRDAPAQPAAALVVTVLLYVPWLPHLGSRDLAIIGALEPLTFHNIVIDLPRVLVGYPYAALDAIPTVIGGAVVGAGALAGIAALLGRHRLAPERVVTGTRHDPPAPGRLGLIVALALATPIGVLLYSAVATDIWDARDLYASGPVALLVLGALLAAIPRPFDVGATIVVLVVLVAGTVRAIGPRYSRPAFRAAASYLDRVAPPADTIVMYPSFLGLDFAIGAQFRARHRLLTHVPARWPIPPIGGTDYAILDESAARALRIGIPHPAGLALTSHRHYDGLVAFSVLGYRPARRP